VRADVGGKVAQLGARLINATAKNLAGQFFDRFSEQIAKNRALLTANRAELFRNSKIHREIPTEAGRTVLHREA
jgi:hypothetical protein